MDKEVELLRVENDCKSHNVSHRKLTFVKILSMIYIQTQVA